MASESTVALEAGKRNRDSSPDGGQWTVIKKKKQRRRTKTTTPLATTSSSSGPSTRPGAEQQPWFAVYKTTDFPSAYACVKALEREFGLIFANCKPESGRIWIRPGNEMSLRILSTTRQNQGKRLHIVCKETTPLRKAVVCDFH